MVVRDLNVLLQNLSNCDGISGQERLVAEIVAEELADCVDDISIDALGNLVAVREGTSGASIMLAAHSDEIGLMVRHIDDKGFLYFVGIGGWYDQTLLSQRVRIHTDSGIVYGVVGSKPPHVMEKEEYAKVIKLKDMYIDVGCATKEEVEKLGISIGSYIAIDREFTRLQNGLVTGKALDNRAGLCIMIEAMKRLKDCPHTVYAVATVQEEVGLKGARTSAFGLDPDMAIAVDVTIAGDHPGVEKISTAVGKGPAVTVADAAGRGIITHPDVLKLITDTARDCGISIQLEVGDGGTTDAMAIFTTGDGIPTGVISVPTRYIHSPVEVLSMADLDLCAELIARCIERF